MARSPKCPGQENDSWRELTAQKAKLTQDNAELTWFLFNGVCGLRSLCLVKNGRVAASHHPRMLAKRELFPERLRRVLRKKAAVVIHLHTLISADLHLYALTIADLHLHALTSADLHLYTLTSADLHLHTLTSADLHLRTLTPAIFTSSHLLIYIFTPSRLQIYIFTPSHLQI